MIRILLVENNDLVRSGILSRRLKRQGFEVAYAFDGGQAVEMAHSKRRVHLTHLVQKRIAR